ncbi:STM4504/CBY_0614 family protein [Mucilaginibacter paludis]|uniref:Abortive infection protein-like C-terminal domain-containing protein n=1 Tax=Mucilaginibacter paludis DSM 18603 TaxID=714943 RepID=H1YEE1_9SPHI|nr:hypothetical protein [Mucilaginibacter paludis]EHQ27175.1 hypothetical protein Mucpa_3071 [Mucilaginibacter paludis DSM 18603]
MAVFNLFSKRQKALTEEPSDILIYDKLPSPFRVQVVHIINDAFGTFVGYSIDPVEMLCKEIHDILCREYGLFDLNVSRGYQERIEEHILREKDINRVLDSIELCFRAVAKVITSDHNYQTSTTRKLEANEAIEELNQRFKEHAIGYQYEDGELIKVDSTYIHSEIVKPTLSLLHNSTFSGANEEYLKAHEHYRHGRNKECLAECLKTFESTMKIICKAKGWSYDEKDTSSTLIKVCLNNDLIPSYMQSQLTSLRSLLESGIPTIRNRIGGHGQGSIPITADDETTRYTLNLTGSNVIYLIELSKL